MPDTPTPEIKYVMMKLTIKEASLIHRIRKYPYANITVKRAKGEPQVISALVEELLTPEDMEEIMKDPDNSRATQELLTKNSQ